MKKAKPDISAEEAEFNRLNLEYIDYIEGLKKKWLKENNHRPNIWALYEIDREEQKRVDGVILRWQEYITPLAENWWEQYGFGIIWPENASDPCQIYKLESAEA